MYRSGRVILLLFMAPTLVVAQDLPTPAEIQQHLHDWRSSFVSLRIGYEQSRLRETLEIRCYRELTLTDTKEYYDMEEWHGLKEYPYRDVFGGNADTRFRAKYRLKDDQSPWELGGAATWPRQNDNTGSAMIFHPLWPLMLPFGHWLDEHPLTEHLTVEGFEEVDGESCVKVTFIHPAFQGSTNFVGWLVPGKDFMVKKTIPPAGSTNTRKHHICDEFQFDGTRWYPLKGRVGNEGPDKYTMNWVVTKFEANPKISRSLFTAPDTTHLKQQFQQKTVSLQQSPQKFEKVPPAVPPAWSSTTWSIILLSCSTLLVLFKYFIASKI